MLACPGTTTLNHPMSAPGRPLRRVLLVVTVHAVLAAGWQGWAAKPSKEERVMKRELAALEADPKPKKRDLAAEPAERKAGDADAQARSLTRLREQLEVTDEAEWTLIAERITKVTEERRTLAGPDGGRRGLPAPAGNKRTAASPENEALRAAVQENLPTAEIRSRLARAHELRVQQETRLARAEAELRAVLTVRQEAMAVLAGLLTP